MIFFIIYYIKQYFDFLFILNKIYKKTLKINFFKELNNNNFLIIILKNIIILYYKSKNIFYL